MIYKSLYPPIEIPSVSLPEFILRQAECHADKIAIVDGLTGRTLTYGGLLGASMRVAAGLAERGLRKGDVLAICSSNAPEYPIALYGASLAGAVVTTLNPLFNPIEAAHQLRDAGAKTLIASRETLGTASIAAAGVADVCVIGDGGGAVPFSSLMECTGPVPNISFDPDEDVAAVLYSSATTGLPKGVMLTHYNLVANVLQTAAVEEMAKEDVIVAIIPFFHVYGFSSVMNLGLHTGATIVTLPRFDLQQFLVALEKHAVTRAYVVPPIVRTLASHPLVDRYDLSALRDVLSAAPPCPRVSREPVPSGSAASSGRVTALRKPARSPIPRLEIA